MHTHACTPTHTHTHTKMDHRSIATLTISLGCWAKMAKVDTRSHRHFVWDASVSTVLHPFLDQAPQESFLQRRRRGGGGRGGRFFFLIPAVARLHTTSPHQRHRRLLSFHLPDDLTIYFERLSESLLRKRTKRKKEKKDRHIDAALVWPRAAFQLERMERQRHGGGGGGRREEGAMERWRDGGMEGGGGGGGAPELSTQPGADWFAIRRINSTRRDKSASYSPALGFLSSSKRLYHPFSSLSSSQCPCYPPLCPPLYLCCFN